MPTNNLHPTSKIILRHVLWLTLACSFAVGYSAEPTMSTNPPRWRFETMRPVHLAEAIRTRPIAWLVLSPLEWHGEAIAFCADPLVGRTIAERAWEIAGGVMIPPLYIGVETEYKEWDANKGLVTRWGLELLTKEHNPGSLYVRPLTLELVLREYLEALQREGFKLAVVVTGHGGHEHVRIMQEVCRRDWGDMRVLLWSDAEHEMPEELQIKHAHDTGHADVSEASLVGGIDPSLVDRDAFGKSERDRKTGLRNENAGAIDFEKGRGIIEYNAKQLAQKVEELVAR